MLNDIFYACENEENLCAGLRLTLSRARGEESPDNIILHEKLNLIFLPPRELAQNFLFSSRFFSISSGISRAREGGEESEWIAQKKHNKISWVKNEVLMKIDVVYLWLFRASLELWCISKRIKKREKNKTSSSSRAQNVKKISTIFFIYSRSHPPHPTNPPCLSMRAFLLFKIHFPKWKKTFDKRPGPELKPEWVRWDENQQCVRVCVRQETKKKKKRKKNSQFRIVR